MIQVVSEWVEGKRAGGGWKRDYYRLCYDEDEEMTETTYRVITADSFRYMIGFFTLESNHTKVPVWRMTRSIKSETYTDLVLCNSALDKQQVDYRAEWVLLMVDIPWIDGVFPNKLVSKSDIVQLYPECKKMPRIYCLDYVRDRV